MNLLWRMLLLLILLLSCSPTGWAAPSLALRISGLPVTLPGGVAELLSTTKLETEQASEVALRHAADDDGEIIRDWLRSEGYLDAEVTPQQHNDFWHWQVQPGALWHIGSVSVEPPPPPQVRQPKVGDPFVTADYERLKLAMRNSWSDQGHLLARFSESQVIPDHSNKVVAIRWRITLGPLCKIGELQVHGSSQYRADLVRHISMLIPGEPAVATTFLEANKRLSSDQHFLNAAVIADEQGVVDDRVPVMLEISEQPARKLTGELGYSSDNGITAGGSWRDQGVDEGTYEYGLQSELSKNNRGLGAIFDRPSWPDARDKTGLQLDFLREQTDGRRFDTVTGGPFWQREFDRHDVVRLTFKQNWLNGDGKMLKVFEPGIALQLDHREGNGLPHSGWRFSGTFAQPWQVNGGGRWVVVGGSLQGYFTLGEWLTASARGGYKRTISLNRLSTPKAYRQFSGGQTSVRGFGQDTLGAIGPDGLAYGGLNAFDCGFDFVFKFNDKVMPVLFYDAGLVWNTPAGKQGLARGAGLGVVVNTMAGPIRVDVAVPIQRRQTDATWQLYIAFGNVL